MAGRALVVMKGRASSETDFSSQQFQTLLRRRLRLGIEVDSVDCPAKHCNKVLDAAGDHPASCMRTGRVRKRATVLERCLARICREAGARVVPNRKLRDMRVGVASNDERSIEVVCYGLPLYHGIPLALDVTQVSPLHADGTPHSMAHVSAGVRMQVRIADKEERYPELVQADDHGVLKFIVLPCEVGGRWGESWFELISQLAKAKSRSAPRLLRRSAEYAWNRRWWDMLAAAAQGGFVSSLVGEGDAFGDLRDGFPPPHSSVMSDSRYTDPAGPSRLPLRG